MGGLSLALSRESSVRAGSVRSTRENSVRASTRESSVRGASGSHQHLGGGGSSQQADLVQTSASGQRTYRGLAVVGGDAGAEAAGCGSGDWMGVTAAPGGVSGWARAACIAALQSCSLAGKRHCTPPPDLRIRLLCRRLSCS